MKTIHQFIFAKRMIQHLRILLVLAFLTLSLSTMMAQITAKRALLVIDVQENLVNPNSKIHMDTAGINLFFNKLNQTISTFDQHSDLVVYIVNEWTNPFMNWGTGNVCKKGGAGRWARQQAEAGQPKCFLQIEAQFAPIRIY